MFADTEHIPEIFKRKTAYVVLVALILLIGGYLLTREVQEIQDTAEAYGATTDWQAVIKREPPYYIVQHYAAEIHYDDFDSFHARIKQAGIDVDIWETYEQQAVAGVSEPMIDLLQELGFPVRVIADSYDDYFNSPAFTEDRGESVMHYE